MTQYEKLNFVNGSPPALNAATLNHMEDGIAAATEGVTALEETVKNNKTETDTALATKADKTEVDTALATKADKTEVDNALSGKLDNTAGSVTTDNIASKAVTSVKIADGSVTEEKLSEDVLSQINYALENVINLYSISTSDGLNNYTDINKTYTFYIVAVNFSLGKELNLDKSYTGITRCILNNYRINSTEIQVLRVLLGSVTDENKQFIRIYNNGWSTFKENTIPNKSVTKEKLSDDLQTELTGKYDASNVDYGIGTLTVAQYFPDSVKSADFVYQRIGKFVTVNINAEFNQYSGNQVGFYGLPFANQITNGSKGICISSLGSQNNNIKWLNDKSWLLITTDNSNGFSDGEKINFTFTYSIG